MQHMYQNQLTEKSLGSFQLKIKNPNNKLHYIWSSWESEKGMVVLLTNFIQYRFHPHTTMQNMNIIVVVTTTQWASSCLHQTTRLLKGNIVWKSYLGYVEKMLFMQMIIPTPKLLPNVIHLSGDEMVYKLRGRHVWGLQRAPSSIHMQ